MTERAAAAYRTQSGWIRASLWVPDSPRKVIVLCANKNGKLSATEARYSMGWRFISPPHRTRRADRVRVWMDIPWWGGREQPSQQAEASAIPAGAKAREESEAETCAAIRANRTDAREEAGLSKAESDFD